VRFRWTALAVLAAAVLAGGCGTTSARSTGSSADRGVPPVAAPAAPALSAVTSTQTTDATWVTIPMGATAGPNEFWQLFIRPAGSQRWRLQTPSGAATNGALVLAASGATLTTGIRPSIDLTFSPVTSTSDEGKSWATSPPQTGLADHPDALAAAPDGHLIAAGQDNQISVLAPHGVTWTTLTSKDALAAAAPACSLTSLTAVAYTPSGNPLAAGSCSRAGIVGIFTRAGSQWRLAGPPLPASLKGQQVQVLRLTRTSTGDEALFQAGTSLIAAWSADGSHWTLSPVLKTATAAPASVSFGVKNELAVVLTGGPAQTVTGPGGTWHALPALPAGHSVALALPPGGPAEALAADGGTLTIWQVTGARWAKVQTIKVPIQYGSSSGS
jgi:hypothetical protein